MSPDVVYDAELSRRVAATFREILDYYERIDELPTPADVAGSVIADLLPGPWILAAAIRDLPGELVDRLPPGTMQRFFELIPINGKEAREVWEMFTREDYF
jgi:hypothetical protein